MAWAVAKGRNSNISGSRLRNGYGGRMWGQSIETAPSGPSAAANKQKGM